MITKNKLIPSNEAIKISSEIIKAKLPKAKIFLYGSRMRGNPSEYSDIDIGILNQKKTTSLQLFEIESRLDEINTVLEINVVDFMKTSPDFRNKVLSYAKEI